MWLRCGLDTAEMWPRCGCGMAEMLRYGLDVAEMVKKGLRMD